MAKNNRKWQFLVSMLLFALLLSGCVGCGSSKNSREVSTGQAVTEAADTNSTVTVYLVRHGQTEANLQGILVGGDGDSPLTEEGKIKVKATGRALKDIPFYRAYSSPLGRAVTTRDLILGENAEASQTERLEEDDFKDISWGKAEGKTSEAATAELGELTPENTFGTVDDPNFVSPIDAESKYHFFQRFNSAMQSIGTDKDNYGKNVLVVAHSSAGFWLSEIFHNDAYSAIDNASVTILKCQDGNWEMVDFNDDMQKTAE